MTAALLEAPCGQWALPAVRRLRAGRRNAVPVNVARFIGQRLAHVLL